MLELCELAFAYEPHKVTLALHFCPETSKRSEFFLLELDSEFYAIFILHLIQAQCGGIITHMEEWFECKVRPLDSSAIGRCIVGIMPLYEAELAEDINTIHIL